jgi:hypothetical protein
LLIIESTMAVLIADYKALTCGLKSLPDLALPRGPEGRPPNVSPALPSLCENLDNKLSPAGTAESSPGRSPG